MSLTKCISIPQLRHFCERSERSFSAYKNVGTESEPLYFLDRGKKVLAVAHLDTVVQRRNFTHGRDIVISGQLDDRLGVYLIMSYIPRFIGAEYDVLLTTNEELCMSTAMHFDPPRQYNWMFSFDRMLESAVLYQYERLDLIEKLADCGIDVGYGTYSDIAELSHLGCAGINFGTGYSHNHHSPEAYAMLPRVEKLVRQFVAFWQRWHDTPMPMETYSRSFHDFDRFYGGYERAVVGYMECTLCHTKVSSLTWYGSHRLCDSCFAYARHCDICSTLTVAYVETDDGEVLCYDCYKQLKKWFDEELVLMRIN